MACYTGYSFALVASVPINMGLVSSGATASQAWLGTLLITGTANCTGRKHRSLAVGTGGDMGFIRNRIINPYLYRPLGGPLLPHDSSLPLLSCHLQTCSTTPPATALTAPGPHTFGS